MFYIIHKSTSLAFHRYKKYDFDLVYLIEKKALNSPKT